MYACISACLASTCFPSLDHFFYASLLPTCCHHAGQILHRYTAFAQCQKDHESLNVHQKDPGVSRRRRNKCNQTRTKALCRSDSPILSDFTILLPCKKEKRRKKGRRPRKDVCAQSDPRFPIERFREVFPTGEILIVGFQCTTQL